MVDLNSYSHCWKQGSILGFSKSISCQCTGKPEGRPGKDSLRIIKSILAWYLHIDKPPVVCVPFREATLLVFLKAEEFWESKTYAKGLYLIEFGWSRANTGAFATAFKICRGSWVICAPLKLHQRIPTTAVCSCCDKWGGTGPDFLLPYEGYLMQLTLIILHQAWGWKWYLQQVSCSHLS